MKLKDILLEDTIKIPLDSQEKKQIIEEMVELLAHAHRVKDRGEVLKAVLDREAVMSTGVGDQVAIPHGKAEGAPEIAAALGITKHAVDFQSIDEKPVRLVWLLVGPPNQTGPHLKALSRISRLMHKREFRDRLIGSRTAAEALAAIAREEEKYFDI